MRATARITNSPARMYAGDTFQVSLTGERTIPPTNAARTNRQHCRPIAARESRLSRDDHRIHELHDSRYAPTNVLTELLFVEAPHSPTDRHGASIGSDFQLSKPGQMPIGQKCRDPSLQVPIVSVSQHHPRRLHVSTSFPAGGLTFARHTLARSAMTNPIRLD
jgi:hypothetical protein